MRSSIRPKIQNEQDDDLEKLQREFLETGGSPSASVTRATPPSLESAPRKEKKLSVFAQRRLAAAEKKEKEPAMPSLEKPVEKEEFEPVMDPFEQPHVPVSKKMLDLTSMLGSVLGHVTEHTVDKVTAPSLPTETIGKPSQRQERGFPAPVHRSEFKKRLVKEETPAPASQPLEAPAPVSDFQEQNTRRIEAMSEEEIEEARQEILGALSAESIALLMHRKKTTLAPKEKKTEKKVTFDEDSDLVAMKSKYFADVPLESEKLAWMDSRFMSQEDQPSETKKEAEAQDQIYRQLRFDLQGLPVNPELDIPRHRGLHHHGDEPEKAGYTLAELFHLVRSQVPSQRAMVLTTIARILWQAKARVDRDTSELNWSGVMDVFKRKDVAATVYLRSALDDRHLVVLVSAVQAMAALVLDNDDLESDVLDAAKFNVFLGHVARPVVAGTVQSKNGLGEKFSATVNRLRNEEEEGEEEEENDAVLAEHDLVGALVKMNILARIRYLIAPESELCETDPGSIERLIRILVRLAQSGQEICTAIAAHDLLDRVLEWGVIQVEWPMTEEEDNNASGSVYPSLAALRLLTVLAQGSKELAQQIMTKAVPALKFLVVSPETASPSMRRRAYALQIETLKLLRVLVCYGLIMPTLEDLQEHVMEWLRSALGSGDEFILTRAATVLGLLEVLLHAAADPHKTEPAHAIDWRQPTAFLPLVIAVVRSSEDKTKAAVYEGGLGYLATWAGYIDKYPPTEEMVCEVWKAAVVQRPEMSGGNLDNRVLRWIQLLSGFVSVSQPGYAAMAAEAETRLVCPDLVCQLKEVYGRGLLGRLALWSWIKQVKDRSVREQLWEKESYGRAELESAVSSAHAGAAETWLAQALVQLSVLDRMGECAPTLGRFYSEGQDVSVSRALFEHDGRPIQSLTYPQVEGGDTGLTAWVFSPIDEIYHLDRSSKAQKTPDIYQVVRATLRTAAMLLQQDRVDHDVAVVSLMKLFLVGDREGQAPGLVSDREIFWDDEISEWIAIWMSRLFQTHVCSLEDAWRRSSAYIRKTQVPFFQFYQTFVGQYASVSFGHPGFSRLLAYVSIEMDPVDYRHLLWGDYRDVLPTIRVRMADLVMPDRVESHESMLRAYLTAVLENKLERNEDQGDAMYRFAMVQLSQGMQTASDSMRRDINDNMRRTHESIQKDWECYCTTQQQ
ncbi:RNA polymerase II associated protein 1 [Apophysomyces sp. BC1034]|nr:RNA polymerase II associated protein 1 [Apophysomyces sp. BC1015]KAG0180136.1 RNA polymerase II associated protein 1 [Apophysomyces sp. BC1021]KAG0188351.1 RNA polymerase II associated protein 1 [Apophysomyces sp. BC1034]